MHVFHGCGGNQDGIKYEYLPAPSWDLSNSAQLTYDPNHLQMMAGKLQVKELDLIDNTASDFSQGTHLGTIYSNKLTLSTNTNNSELDASWTPKYSNLIAYFKFNGDFSDEMGNINDLGIASGSPTLTAGKLNQTYSFNGTSDALITATNAALPIGTAKRTFLFWMKAASFDTGIGNTILSYGISLVGEKFVIKAEERSISVALYGHRRIGEKNELEINEWYHIAVIVPSSATQTDDVKIYINGKIQTLSTESGGSALLNTSASQLEIGSASGTKYYDGLIDELTIWDVALSGSNIRQIYARQAAAFSGTYTSKIFDTGENFSWSNFSWLTSLPAGKELTDISNFELMSSYPALTDKNGMNGDSELNLGLVAHWKFNEESSYNGTAGEVVDSSGSNNHGIEGGGSVNTSYRVDKFYRSLKINGTGDRVNVADSTSLQFDQTFTIAGWFYPEKWKYNPTGLIAKSDGAASSNWQLLYDINDNELYFTMGGTGNGGQVTLFKGDGISLTTTKWSHITLTRDNNEFTLYINAVAVAQATSNKVIPKTDDITIGEISTASSTNRIAGWIDEVALWNRNLHPKEIIMLYRRGANNVKFQIRSCDDVDCIGESFIGPNGTKKSYFSELDNNSILNAFDDPTGSVQALPPNLIYTDFSGGAVTSQRYFQYRVILESDDVNSLCGASNCMPDVSSVKIDSNTNYYGGVTAVVAKAKLSHLPLRSFTTVETQSSNCTIAYQISVNGGADYYYWDGSTWATATTATQCSSATDVNSNIRKLVKGRANITYKAYFDSDLTATCSIEKIIFGR